MCEEDLRAEAMVFTSAALEGVAAFISPLIDNITQNPEIYVKVRTEIENFEAKGLMSSPVVKFEETNNLSFFMACVYETLRHDAPAQTILPRYVSEGGILGYSMLIPDGTEIAASPYIIHRDKDTFGEDADDFRPERWLEDPMRSERMQRGGMWFGYGNRECPGKYFAHLEFQKLCVELFRRFQIESAVPENRFTHKRWAVAMYWNHWLRFTEKQGLKSG